MKPDPNGLLTPVDARYKVLLTEEPEYEFHRAYLHTEDKQLIAGLEWKTGSPPEPADKTGSPLEPGPERLHRAFMSTLDVLRAVFESGFAFEPGKHKYGDFGTISCTTTLPNPNGEKAGFPLWASLLIGTAGAAAVARSAVWYFNRRAERAPAERGEPVNTNRNRRGISEFELQEIVRTTLVDNRGGPSTAAIPAPLAAALGSHSILNTDSVNRDTGNDV